MTRADTVIEALQKAAHDLATALGNVMTLAEGQAEDLDARYLRRNVLQLEDDGELPPEILDARTALGRWMRAEEEITRLEVLRLRAELRAANRARDTESRAASKPKAGSSRIHSETAGHTVTPEKEDMAIRIGIIRKNEEFNFKTNERAERGSAFDGIMAAFDRLAPGEGIEVSFAGEANPEQRAASARSHILKVIRESSEPNRKVSIRPLAGVRDGYAVRRMA